MSPNIKKNISHIMFMKGKVYVIFWAIPPLLYIINKRQITFYNIFPF